jgi:hypothetical protein
MYIAKNRRNLSADAVVSDIDLVFKYIDRAMNLNCAVGENLLNSELPDICTYLYENYSWRYGNLTVQTNGSIVPENNAMRRFKDSGTIFGISNYPENAESTMMFIEKCNEFGIKWYYNAAGGDRGAWIDYGDPRVTRETDSVKLRELYNECWKPGMAVYNGRLYICSLQMWSHLVAEVGSLEPGDAFDLRQLKTESSCSELHRIISRQPPEKGYIDHCMRCNGVMTLLNRKE